LNLSTATSSHQDISLEPASLRDLLPLRSLERACFPKDAWPLLDLIGVLTLPNVVRLKAIHQGELIGFIAGDIRRSEGLAWIATFCVSPDYRERGIGKLLLEACEERLPLNTIRLSVRASNQVAIGLYENAGYTKISEWPRYYQDGEAAIVMEKRRP
jgi:ribosomal-protein-alanine N-acetyltransferase